MNTMNFLLSKHQLDNPKINLKFYCNIGEYSLFIGFDNISNIQNRSNENIIVFGDCINAEILNEKDKFSASYLKQLKGIFTLVIITGDSFQIYSSLFGFLPVFYSNDFNVISNSLDLIKRVGNYSSGINKQYIIESYLFNYSFSNQTYLKQIKRLSNFSYICYEKGKFEVKKYMDIADWFIERPLNGINQLSNLASLFLNQVQHYYTDEINSITFTSGFDGRTILSAATLHQIKFDTFSFGRIWNPDVEVPLNNSRELNIPYHYYDLGLLSYQNEYFDLATKFSRLTGGFNGFLYAHFLYGAEQEKAYSDNLLTGYCGSELFRALHIQGAITSRELVSIFTETNDKKLKENLWNSSKLIFIQKSDYKEEFDNLFGEILQLRETKKKYFSINHFFYHYIFTEVFRKVFGAWTVAQMQEMNVRTPFLDYDFVLELLKTDLAGCNNYFFTHNPLKRLKGQLLYAEIIRQSNSQLYKMKTGKGYRPIDLLTLQGKVRILFPYLKKRHVKQSIKPNLDNLGIISAYQYHKNEIESLYKNLEGFEISRILESSNNLNPYTSEEERGILLQTASLASIL